MLHSACHKSHRRATALDNSRHIAFTRWRPQPSVAQQSASRTQAEFGSIPRPKRACSRSHAVRRLSHHPLHTVAERTLGGWGRQRLALGRRCWRVNGGRRETQAEIYLILSAPTHNLPSANADAALIPRPITDRTSKRSNRPAVGAPVCDAARHGRYSMLLYAHLREAGPGGGRSAWAGCAWR